MVIIILLNDIKFKKRFVKEWAWLNANYTSSADSNRFLKINSIEN